MGRLVDSAKFLNQGLQNVPEGTALRGRMLQRLSRVKWAAGQKVQSRVLGDAAIDVLDGADNEDLAMALASRAQIAMSDYDMAVSLPLAKRAEDMARRLGLINIVSHSLSTQSLTTLFDNEETSALHEESIAMAEQARSPIDLVRCYANGGVLNWCLLNFHEALAWCEKAIATAYETDTTEQIEFHRGYRAYDLERLGRWDDAIAEVRDVLARPLESASPAIMLRLTIARIAMRRGDSDGEREEAEIRKLLGDEEDARHICDVANFVAERAWLGLADLDAAQVFIDQALAINISPLLMEELLDWQRRLDPSRLPRDLSDTHPPYAAAFSGDWHIAAAEWHNAGDPYREALSYAEGDAASVTKALAILDKLGAAQAQDQVIKRANARGLTFDLPASPRATTRTNPAGLTKRQLDVLKLINDGLSNAEIGTSLFISPKTVDHHVSAILGKLEVSTRGEASAAARAAGWLDQN